LEVLPRVVQLDERNPRQTLLVSGIAPPGRAQDLSGRATYRSSNPKVAVVAPDGTVRWTGPGQAAIEVKAAGRTAKVLVRAARPAGRPVSFTNDVMPTLAKAGCYQAACHAKQGGKSGFQLSVLAFDAEADYTAIARQAHGRRINRQEPGKSLLLAKATLAVPHGGGQRFKAGSPEYRLLARWIAEGARFGEGDPTLVRLEVEPKERVLGHEERQRLVATAVYSDGSRRDVTELAQYRSNEVAVAEAAEGAVRTSRFAGEAAIMVRYLGQVAVARVTVPLNEGIPASAYAGLPRQNFVDDLVYRKLQQLNVLPSPPCDDATFLRRASLDLIGTLPTPDEAREFLRDCAAEKPVFRSSGVQVLQSRSSTKPDLNTRGPQTRIPEHLNTAAIRQQAPALSTRAKLVEKLLDRPEYADYWAMRWSNLLMVNPDLLLPRGAYAFDQWLREAFRKNMPYDRFAAAILTATGDSYREGPPNFFRAVAEPADAGKAVSELFLGVRLDCAQCHHHPFERWGQDDFYGFAAFFARVKSKSSYPEGYHSIVYDRSEGEVQHPKTGATMPPRPLGTTPQEMPAGEERRAALVRWMTAPDNPYFARAIVNRVWSLLMGRGLVEPVDDFRASNPASNEPLLDALAKDFAAHGYDLKHLLKTITASAAYQRSSEVTPGNAKDTRNYSHAYTRRLPAEVLLDAVSRVSGIAQSFRGHPVGTRAIEMWDSRLEVEFLDLFGRPGRQSVCECERSNDGSVTQMLHLMNANDLQGRLTSDKGTAAVLAASSKSEEEIVAELYLLALGRNPTAEELRAAVGAFHREKVTRRAAVEDLLWVLMNSAEFLLNH
jgi:hypothetical protein